MLYKKEGLPKVNELVICTIKKILPLSAFVSLDEYKDKEGLLHVSEIAHRVKKIKDFIKIGQIVVCKVLNVNEKQGYIDVSLRKVRSFEEKNKFNEWKKVHRIENILKAAVKKSNSSEEEITKVEEQLIKAYENIAYFFDSYVESKEESLEDINMPAKLKENFLSMLKELEKKKEFVIKLNLYLSSYDGDGVLRIKKVLNYFNEQINKMNVKPNISYLGSSKYLVRIPTKDVKKIDKALKDVLEETEKISKKENIIFSSSKKKWRKNMKYFFAFREWNERKWKKLNFAMNVRNTH